MTHVTIASLDRAVLCPEPGVLLRTVRAVARSEVLLFCVVDDHVHAVVARDRRGAGPAARGLAYALGSFLPVELAPARFRPVDGRSHLRTLVAYVLDQPRKHGLRQASAIWPGSCFVDLVGARVIDGFDARRLATALPRLGRADLYEAVGLPPVAPLGADELLAEGAARIVEAAASAVAMERLEGSGVTVVRARRAAGRLCRDLGFRDVQTAFALGCPRSTASRLVRTAPPDPALDRAIRLQLALRRVTAGLPESGRREVSGDGPLRASPNQGGAR